MVKESRFVSEVWTERGGFTEGECSVFLELPPGSIGNGIRFDSRGNMLIADYVGHRIWRVLLIREISNGYVRMPLEDAENFAAW
ncbi:hypothetical protein ABND12_02330 [Paenibacillus larvae]